MEQEKQNFGAKVKEKLDISIRLPVIARLKKRIKEIQFLSQAKTVKIPMGNTHKFETTEPQMFICNLEAKITNGVGIISYQTYKMDGKNKKINNTYSEVVNSKGDKVKVLIDASYVIDKIIIERIEHMKPIMKEEMNYE